MRDLKRIVGFVFTFFILFNLSAQDWQEVDGIDTNRIFKEMVFLDLNNGVAIDDLSRIWLTTTSSTNWEENPYNAGQPLNALEAIDANQFWVTGDNGTLARGNVQGATISYVPVSPPTANDINNCYFITQDIGWFVGDNGTLFRTENFGTTFEVQNVPGLFVDYTDIAVSDNTGIIITSDNRIGISRDGGKSWELGTTLPTTDNVQIEIFNNFFYVLSANSTILRSLDGDNWTIINTPVNEINKIEVGNGAIYLAANEGKSFVSNSAGANWQELNGVPDAIDLTVVSCIDNGCFTGGSKGKVYWNCQRITFGGKIWGDKTPDCTLSSSIENGYTGVNISLLNSFGIPISSTVTDNNGDYRFVIPEGNYNVRIDASNFDIGMPLFGAIPCGTANDPNDNVLGDQNGIENGGAIILPNDMVLRCGEELGQLGVVNTTADIGLTFTCNTATHPQSTLFCNNPNFICDLSSLDNNCYTMTDNVSTGGGFGCLGEEENANLTWFTFYGGLGNYQLNITKEGCFPGDNGETGFKVGLIRECGDSPEIYCEDLCQTGGAAVINSTLLVPGQLYYIWVDGCGGSTCGYTTEVTGNYNPYIAPQPAGLNCNDGSCDNICLGSTVSIEVDDVTNSYGNIDADFNWEIVNSIGGVIFTQQTDTNMVSYDFNQVGTFQICLKSIENFCGEQIINYCESVAVIEIFDEDFGEVGLCPDELLNYIGPEFVNGDPSNTNDPNGDGFTGWQQPSAIVFMPGFNSQIITHPLGCEYEQFINIIPNSNSEIAEFEFVVCDDDEFPVFVLDQNYFQQTNDFFINIPGGAENGCDSLNSLTIYHIEIDGSIQQQGCDNNNVLLEFVPTLNMNTFGFPVIVEWIDASGNLLPDDGDNDPFTTQVPFGNEVYMVNIGVDAAGLRTCTYTFSSLVSFDLPTISGLDTICVNDEAQFLFSFPSGNVSTPLWNVEDGEFEGNFVLDEVMNISWPTSGIKTITLAYLEDGCYVEQMATIEVLPKYAAADFVCTPADNMVTFSWPDLAFNQVDNIEVISGQQGVLSGNTFTIDNLHGGESVTISIDINSMICEPYSIVSICSANPCEGIDIMPDYTECEAAFDDPLCDLTLLSVGCSTLDSTTTENIGGPCLIGSIYNMKWIPFVAGTGDYAISVELFNCGQQGIDNGVQFAIFKDCDYDNPVICSDVCHEDEILINSIYFDPGQQYFLMLNGCNGTSCDYSMSVIGDYQPFEFPDINDFSINGAIVDSTVICLGEEVLIDIDNSNSLNSALFNWSIRDLDGNVTDTLVYDQPSFNLSADILGAYLLCLDEIVHPCESIMFNDKCKYIDVKKAYDQIEITCDQSTNEIIFSWESDPGHIIYNVEVLTGQTGIVDGTSFTVSNLNQDETVTIRVATEVLDGCNELVTEQTCIASTCPQVNVIIDTGGPFSFCLTDSTSLFDFTPNVTPAINGEGVFSGVGVVDSIEGIYDPSIPGVGNHVITYTFTGEDSCVYSTSSDIFIGKDVIASFELSNSDFCIGEEFILTFTGEVNDTANVVWDFGGLEVINGSDIGPYNLSANSVGDYFINLSINDNICGVASFSDTVSITNCSACICDNIIDTTVLCTTIFEPVCGCDGITYSNACEAQFYAGVRSWTNGPCNQTSMDTIAAFCDDDNPLTINDGINADCECEGEVVSGLSDNELSIEYYPNPTNGKVFFKGLENKEIVVYNLLGQQVFLTKIVNNQIDLSALSPGIFILKVGESGVIRVYKE